MKKEVFNDIATCLFIIGFMIILGVTGRADYANEHNEVYPVRNLIIGVITGVALTIPAIVEIEEIEEFAD